MESWVRNVEMMDPRMDVREDRLTKQLKDEWSLMAGLQWHTDRQRRPIYTHRSTQNVIIPSFYMQWLLAKNIFCWWCVSSDGADLIREIFLDSTLLRERPWALWSSTWSTVNMSPAQQLVCAELGESVCLHLPLLPCVCMCMHEHMHLYKIHLCHHVDKHVFVLVQSKTEHVWPWLEVTSGAKLNKEVYLLSPREKNLAALWCPLDLVKTCCFLHRGKPCRVFVVSAWQK